MKRLFTVDSIAGGCVGGVLNLQVSASANSGGWGEPVLNRLRREGDTVTYEIVATAPTGPAVTMMMQMFMVTHTDRDVRGVAEVRVLAATNEMSAKLTRCGS